MTKIIDCTLRDGGYLTNWTFDEKFVRDLYKAATASGVEYLEAGYRNISSADEGDFYSCKDDFLFSVFKNGCKISLMADAGKSDLSLFELCTPDKTPASLVRIAAYPHELKKAIDFCEGLKDKKYEVMLNLMSFGRYSDADINLLKNWENKNILLSVCFSDSFGSFTPEDINIQLIKLSDIGFKNISFHSHNNLQLAFANSMKFVELGGYTLDASAGGMGRNGGILPMELVLAYLQKKYKSIYDVLPYLQFLYKYRENFGNVNLVSIISGLKNIHPKYVTDLFKNYSDISLIWQKAEEIQMDNKIAYKS